MLKDKRKETVIDIIGYFPKYLKEALLKLPDKTLNEITEIRLCAERPLSLTVNGENVFLSERGYICYLAQQGLLRLSRDDVELIFLNMCEHSVYAFSEQIKHGYITLKNGCRAGLAASAVYENGMVSGFTAVSSINIRIAAEVLDCAKPIAEYLNDGLLIAGPPSSGKTTVLRDSIRLIADGIGTRRRRVSVVDTRNEIAAVKNGVPTNDLGYLTDVISNCDKQTGIEIALRTLNPQVIAFDEIGLFNEAEMLIKAFHSGAMALCTAHCGSIEELTERETIMYLLRSRVIKNIAFLSGVGKPPMIVSTEHVLKNIRSSELA